MPSRRVPVRPPGRKPSHGARQLAALARQHRLDRRTAPVRAMATVADGLAVDLGGWDHVPAGKALLIERASFKVICCRLIEAAAIRGGIATLDTKNYATMANSLQRDLVALGLDPVRERAPSLADYLAAHQDSAPQVRDATQSDAAEAVRVSTSTAATGAAEQEHSA